MVEIKKSEITSLIISHYQTQLKESTYHIYAFQQKYNCSFTELESSINSSEKEQYGQWEDYMEWKGHLKSAEYLTERIQKIEHGLFTIA
ncbi:MAG: hypothetical protein AAGG68_25975 [Bacteroidota bacterium]